MPSTDRGPLLLILVVWALTMGVELGNTALWEPDEPRFAEATRQMLERGDFITPWFNDRPRYEKPPLLYWLQVPFVAALGATEAAFRIPSSLSGLLSLVLIYHLGARLVSPSAGLIASVALATTFRYVLYARQGLTDLPVTAFVTLSIWAFQRAFTASEGRSRPLALLGWGAVGCAALMKGPVAAIGPLVWGIAAAVIGWRTGWTRWHLPGGIILAAVIALPWHVAMVVMHGRAFLDVALGYEVVARYLSPDFPGRERGFFYFFGAWLGDGAPWSLFFLGALVWAATSWRSMAANLRTAVMLAIVWFFTVLLLFSVSEYKLPHYIMPAYPPAALLAGVFADAVWRGRVPRLVLWRVPAALSSVLLLGGAVSMALLLRRAFGLPARDPSFLLPLILALGAAGILISMVRGSDRHVLTGLLLTLVVGYAYVVSVVAPRELRRFQPIPDLARAVTQVAAPGEPLAVAGNYGAPGLVFYARRHVEQLVNREQLVEYLSGPGPRHCVLPLAEFDAVQASVPRAYRIVARGDVFSVRMRRLLERAPERAGRTLVLVSAN